MIIPELLSLVGGTGTWSEINYQSHTHIFREREKKEGRRRSGEWKDTANEPLKDSQIACLP